MKKLKYILLLLIVFNAFSYSEKKFSLDITWSMLKPADTSYQKIYTDKPLYPEIILAYKFKNNVFIYSGFGFLKEEGEIDTLDYKVKSDQNYISFGLGYEFMSKKRINFRLSGGIIFVNYEGIAYFDDNLTGMDKGNRTGYKFDIGLYYNLTKTYVLNFIAGYFHGQNTTDYSRKLSYGGLKIGAGVGLRF